MKRSAAEKVIGHHLVEGKAKPAERIGLRIDHTLTQDSTGTLTYLEFEALGVPKVKTKLSLSFVDHNLLQNDFRNPDDHRYLKEVAAKYGIVFSRPGNGICHQIHLERFARPGYTLLGSDSHTPTAGGMGMVAIGAGGLDIAAAMAGEPFFLEMPIIMGVQLTGKLSAFVSAKDIILEVLKRLTVKGGVNKILEYYGPGIRNISVPERATITNMGTETGATTSIFPSDQVTKGFLRAQNREDEWVELKADEAACYEEEMELDLGALEPLVALPHSPDNVKRVSEVEGTPVDQVCIGSCTNSSLRDLKLVAALLKGRKISDRVSLTVSPGSRQVLENIAASGELVDIIKAGARILENGCGPCIGIGQAPQTDAVSIRTFNRNFRGRSGTQSAQVFLASPETAIASAIFGEIADPRKLGKYPKIQLQENPIIEDNMLIFPPKKTKTGEVFRGPNIKPLPEFPPIGERVSAEVLLKLGDNISTDDILPGGSEIMALRSNIPKISEYAFGNIDPTFMRRALERKRGFIVGGENYGQGSSREHAALVPRYLGIQAVIAKSFARIHLANLINFGILPLIFLKKQDYEDIAQDDHLVIELEGLRKDQLCIKDRTRNLEFQVDACLSSSEKEIVKAGGKLAAIKAKHAKDNVQ